MSDGESESDPRACVGVLVCVSFWGVYILRNIVKNGQAMTSVSEHLLGVDILIFRVKCWGFQTEMLTGVYQPFRKSHYRVNSNRKSPSTVVSKARAINQNDFFSYFFYSPYVFSISTGLEKVQRGDFGLITLFFIKDLLLVTTVFSIYIVESPDMSEI